MSLYNQIYTKFLKGQNQTGDYKTGWERFDLQEAEKEF